MNENNNVEQGISVIPRACWSGLFDPDENGKVVIPDRYTGEIFCETFSWSYYKDEKAIKDFVANGITAIQTYAFNGNDTLINISLPSITFIERQAFNDCDNWVNVYLPNVTKILQYAFLNCKSIEELDLPKLEKIRSDTFSKMIGLKTINMPSLII